MIFNGVIQVAGGGGGGTKAAYGTQEGDGTNVFSVSGLGFSPSNVVVVKQESSGVSGRVVFSFFSLSGNAQSWCGNLAYCAVFSGTLSASNDGFTATVASDVKFPTMTTYAWMAIE